MDLLIIFSSYFEVILLLGILTLTLSISHNAIVSIERRKVYEREREYIKRLERVIKAKARANRSRRVKY